MREMVVIKDKVLIVGQEPDMVLIYFFEVWYKIKKLFRNAGKDLSRDFKVR